MVSLIYFNNSRLRLNGFVLLAVMLILTGCTIKKPVVVDTGGRPALPAPTMVTPRGSNDQATESRIAAAHSLIREGYQLLQNKDYDGAIRVLERAVGINPNDGPGYFYLAEAWLAKKDFDLAARFNGLATLYLRSDPAWSRQARIQQLRIERDKEKDEPG